jgi:hypothetical protein
MIEPTSFVHESEDEGEKFLARLGDHRRNDEDRRFIHNNAVPVLGPFGIHVISVA